MSSVNEATINEIKITFQKIHELLELEKEDNWIRGIENILSILNKTDINKINFGKIYDEVRASYRSMNSGQGSFADLVIWKDDYDERMKLNQEFEVLADRVWRLLDL